MSVWPPTLDEAKAHLNIPPSDTTQDAEVSQQLAAATQVVEELVGPVNPTSVTGEQHDTRHHTVTLRVQPVLAVTRVVEWIPTPQELVAEDPSGVSTGLAYRLDATVGTVTRVVGGWPIPFLGRVVVDYTAGRSVVPENLRLAVLELLRLNWGPQRGGMWGRPVTAANPEDYSTSLEIYGFYVPRRVLDLLGVGVERQRQGIA